jgi:predicted kinase
MANLLIPMGIPGSGKSTWVKTMLDGKYTIISSDAIRKSLFGSLKAAHTPDEKAKNNAKVWDIFYRDIEEALKHNVDVVADATNLRAFARERLREIAERTGAKTHLLVFNNLDQACLRNVQRNEDAVVPDAVMDDMIDQWEVAMEAILDGLEDYEVISVIAGVE